MEQWLYIGMPMSIIVIIAINKNIIVEACKIRTNPLNGIQFFKLLLLFINPHIVTIIVLIDRK